MMCFRLFYLALAPAVASAGITVSFVRAISFEDIQSQFDTGGTYEGYRHLTVEEAWYVFEAGYGWDHTATPEENAATALNILQGTPGEELIMGGTLVTSLKGFIVDTGLPFMVYYQRYQPFFENEPFGRLEYGQVGPLDPSEQSYVMHMITVVPEPATFTLTCSVILLGVVFWRRILVFRA